MVRQPQPNNTRSLLSGTSRQVPSLRDLADQPSLIEGGDIQDQDSAEEMGILGDLHDMDGRENMQRKSAWVPL